MGKIRVRDFGQSVCMGKAASVDGPCPHLATADGQTGQPVIDALARAESRLLRIVSGDEQFKCGLCGCPLANLAALDRAPDRCPRIQEHGGRGPGGI